MKNIDVIIYTVLSPNGWGLTRQQRNTISEIRERKKKIRNKVEFWIVWFDMSKGEIEEEKRIKYIF